jgi:hypothetical protein
VKKTVLHIAFDDKFVDAALREFEAIAPGKNKLIIIGKVGTLQFVKESNPSFMGIAEVKTLASAAECAAVIFHSLNNDFLKILADIPRNKKTIWIGWGYDYYDCLLSGAYPNGLLLPQTQALVARFPKTNKFLSPVRRAKSLIGKILGRTSNPNPALLGRIDYFIPVLDIEHKIIADLNPWFKARYLCWNYGTVEDDLSGNTSPSEKIGSDIMVGNSATPENNHLEIFEMLSRLSDTSGRRIIVPLSYGDECYKHRIIEAGHRHFGSNFLPLTNFMEKDKYISILDRCGYVFMNHLRQQALGNICIMMLKGAKIYLNSKNPLYKWFLAKGAIIFTIDDLVGSENVNSFTYAPITELQQKKNIDVVNNHWAREVQRERTRRLIDVALTPEAM